MPAKQGSAHHNAKMTPASVRAARKAFTRGGRVMVDGKLADATIASLARKYGITHQSMRSILFHETWRHVS